jgi:hypothetical protein
VSRPGAFTHVHAVRFARAELLAADPHATSVAPAAPRRGFAHPDCFAEAHRRIYGSPQSAARGGRNRLSGQERT